MRPASLADISTLISGPGTRDDQPQIRLRRAEQRETVVKMTGSGFQLEPPVNPQVAVRRIWRPQISHDHGS